MQGKGEVRALTGVRGTAALLIVVYHMGVPSVAFRWSIHQAYLAVDLFFILSGFVMCYNYEQIFRFNGSVRAYTDFLWLRIARIWPLCAVTSIVALLVLTLYSREEFPSATVIFSNLLLAQGWGFSLSINPPLWSVSAEVAAYALFPALLAVTTRPRPMIAALTAVCCAVSLVAICFLASANGVGRTGPMDIYDAYGSLPVIRCLAGFTLGILVWRISLEHTVCRIAANATIQGICLAGMLLLSQANVHDLLIYPLLVALILCLSRDQGPLSKLFGCRPMHRLGVLSFALYAVHAPIIMFAKPLMLAATDGLPTVLREITYSVVIIGGLLMVSVAAHYGIERPARNWARRRVFPSVLKQAALSAGRAT